MMASHSLAPPRPRILLLPHLSETSGAPLMALRIGEGLIARGYSTHFLFPCEGGLVEQARGKGLSHSVSALIPMSFREAASAGRRLEWLRSRRIYLRDLNRAMREYRPEIVYIHSVYQLAPGLVARARKIPVAWHVQETMPEGALATRIRKAAVRRVSRAVIFCGWYVQTPFGQPRPGQIHVVAPNALVRSDTAPVEPRERETIRRELGLAPEEPVVICVGGVQPRKGMDVVIEALGILAREENLRPAMLFAGVVESAYERYKAALEERCRDLGIEAQVRFLGHRDDVGRLLAAADVFAMASRSEGLPLSVVEAFSAGLPAVLTAAGDCAALAGQGERGFCVAREDAKAFARGLATLLRDPEKRLEMGRRARAYAAENFRFDSMMDIITGALDAAAAPRSRH